jgi:hypothetical protein
MKTWNKAGQHECTADDKYGRRQGSAEVHWDLKKSVQNYLGDTAFVDVAAFEQHFCCSFAYPAGDNQCPSTSSCLLRNRWYHPHV